MKRYFAGLTALAAASGFAQSSVTLSGQLDTALTSVQTRTAAGVDVRKTGLYSAGMASSFLRFEGREDLGGGLQANFRLETGVNTDSGSGLPTNANNQRFPAGAASDGLTFNRWAFVGLSSKELGEVRLGRVYTAAFENFTPFDPFFTNGVASSTPITLRLGTRNTQTALNVSNAIEYLTPGYGLGFFGRVTVAFGENPSNGTLAGGNPEDAGDHVAFRVGYGTPAWTVAYSHGLTKNTAGAVGAVNNQGDYRNSNLAARFNAGFATFYGQFVNEELEGASAAGGALTGNPAHEAKTRSLLLGASVPLGAGNLKVSIASGKLTDNIGSAAEKGRLIGVGYDYFFSKRTNAYATLSRISNNGVGNYGLPVAYVTAGRGQSTTGVGIGLKHIF
ncbi:MAG: porin [Burkholderiaceae bacterium]